MILLALGGLLAGTVLGQEFHLFQAEDASTVPRVSASASASNILFIFPDQWRGDYLELGAHTPNLQMLARDSRVFQRAYSSTPSCTPARTTLLTGQNQYRHHVRGPVGTVPPEEEKSVYRRLQRAGYSVGLAGKAHFGSVTPSLGFDSWYLHDGYTLLGKDSYSLFLNGTNPVSMDAGPANGLRGYPFTRAERVHATTWTGMAALRWLRRRDRTRPFFLQFGPHRPHSPYDPPKRFLDLYNRTECEHCTMRDNWHQHHKTTCNVAKSQPFVCNPGPEHMLQSRRAYLASMSHVDVWVGKLVTELKREKIYDSTTIIFSSDHGDLNGDHFMWRKGNFPEGSCRIPLIVKPPAQRQMDAGASALVGLEDLAPTFLAAAGLGVPSYMTGHSLFAPVPRQHMTIEHHPENFIALLTRADPWKYVISEGRELLFNLERDPAETTDRSARNTTVLQTKREELVAYLVANGQAQNPCYFQDQATLRMIRRATPQCKKYIPQ